MCESGSLEMLPVETVAADRLTLKAGDARGWVRMQVFSSSDNLNPFSTRVRVSLVSGAAQRKQLRVHSISKISSCNSSDAPVKFEKWSEVKFSMQFHLLYRLS